MAEPDPSGNFDSVSFKADIRAAMLMGLPNAVEMRPTFRFQDVRVFANVDEEGSPFDWEDDLTGDPPPDPVQALCAVETIGQGEASEGTNIGTFEWKADQNPPHDYATALNRVRDAVRAAGGDVGEGRIVG